MRDQTDLPARQVTLTMSERATYEITVTYERLADMLDTPLGDVPALFANTDNAGVPDVIDQGQQVGLRTGPRMGRAMSGLADVTCVAA